jgi:hypothetical protein
MSYYKQTQISEVIEAGEYHTDLGLLSYDGEDWTDKTDWTKRPKFWLKQIEGHVLTEEELKEKMFDFAKFICK